MTPAERFWKKTALILAGACVVLVMSMGVLIWGMAMAQRASAATGPAAASTETCDGQPGMTLVHRVDATGRWFPVCAPVTK